MQMGGVGARRHFILHVMGVDVFLFLKTVLVPEDNAQLNEEREKVQD